MVLQLSQTLAQDSVAEPRAVSMIVPCALLGPFETAARAAGKGPQNAQGFVQVRESASCREDRWGLVDTQLSWGTILG